MQLSSHDSNAATDEHSSQTAKPGAQDLLPRWRRLLRWWLVAGIAVLLLILLPPLINVNHYQRQIARSMSLSLGRPVHLDNVSFRLLPVPGLTLSNLVVSEEPPFGAEPTIRANTVEASLRLSSLWRGRLEFSTVRFVEPSVNLVRNAEGRWNLANVLLHAAQVTTAPTAQRRAGPAPRFPYIEATGGRVNVKLGNEKLPFSLTAADFALWQPSPHQWRVRLRGQPDRTDANMTDPGSLRIEGDLLQATTAEDVRVDLHANWYDAPLGEATLLVTGNDLGWRGHLNLEAQLSGTLNAARVSTKLTLGGLRRAEFAPAHPLDLQLTCSSEISVQTVLLKKLACSLPDNGAQPMTLTAPEVNLQQLEETQATLAATAIPNRWALLWGALFSPRIITDSPPAGTLDVQFNRSPQSPAQGSLPAAGSRSAWSGRVTERLPVSSAEPSLALPGGSGIQPELVFQSAFNEPSPATSPGARMLFRLAPTTVHASLSSSLQVEGAISTVGYAFQADGTGGRTALAVPVRFVPELGDDLDAVLPSADTGQDAAKTDFTCRAAWGTAQVCVSTAASPLTAGPVETRHGRRRTLARRIP